MDALDLNGRWNETAAGTNAGATATHSAVAGKTFIVTQVSGFSDTDCTITLNDGTTAIAQWAIDVSVDGIKFVFDGIWVITGGAATSAVISASTSDCQVNISGIAIP
jgi:hypothetical protein